MSGRKLREAAQAAGDILNASGTGTELELRAAMQRLLAGRPIRGSRDLTVTNLAREAAVSRATANRYPEVLEQFRLAIRSREEAPTPPDDREALRRLEAQHKAERATWSARESDLEATVGKYAQQIQYLSVQLESLQAKLDQATGEKDGARVLQMRPRR